MYRLTFTVLALCLLATTAQAQLSSIEQHCRMNGDHVAAVLIDRAKGATLTDILIGHERQFEARQLPSVWRQHYHDLTRMAYGLSDITPAQGRQLQEAVCLEVHNTTVSPRTTPRTRTPITKDPNRY